LHKIAEVVFGSLVGIIVSLAMSKVWLIQPSAKETRAA
jgi:acid phosphatase family membrane protein YuiD